MPIINVVGFDPALKNLGIARMRLDITTLELEMDYLRLIQTEKQTNKVVRQNSDDLRRAGDIYGGIIQGAQGCAIAFAEIPSGAQTARAALSFGIAIGCLAACPIPLIEVQPSETKLAAVGTKTASKQEMIEWATEVYPDANWLRAKQNGAKFKKGDFTGDNEHMADAVGVIHAGIKTAAFQQLRAIWLANPVATAA